MQLCDSDMSSEFEWSDIGDEHETSTTPLPGNFVTSLQPNSKKRWKATKIESKAVAQIFGQVTACVSAFYGAKVVVFGGSYDGPSGNPWICEPFQKLRDSLAVVALQCGPKKCDNVSSATKVCGTIITDWINCEYQQMLQQNPEWKQVIGMKRGEILQNETGSVFYCAECDQYFASGHALGGHRSIHSLARRSLAADQQWQCKECGAAYKHLKSLRLHYRKKHENATLRVDPKVMARLDQEIALQIGITPYYCSECKRHFKSAQSLGGHRSIMHSVNNKKHHHRCFECTQCGAAFKKQNKLDRHIASSHSDERPFKCEERGCGKSYKRKDRLDRHLMRHQTQKRFKCCYSGCVLQFNRKDRLRRHIRDIHGPPRYHCEFCSERFRKKRKLRKHMALAHNAQCPFVCTECTRRFARQIDLDRHHHKRHEDRVEDGRIADKAESLDICWKCSASFEDRELYKLHLSLCIGPDATLVEWKCDVCAKEYEHWSSLRRHYWKRHKIKKAFDMNYHCKECNQTFKNRQAFGGHLSVHAKNRFEVQQDMNANGKAKRENSLLTALCGKIAC